MTPRSPSVLVGWDPLRDEMDSGGNGQVPAAAEWAARIADACQLRLVLFSSYAELREALDPEAYRAARISHDHQMASFHQQMREQGISCDIERSSDDLRVSLLRVADEQRSELIVVGREPTSRPGFLHLGSEIEFLAHHTDRPLAIIGSGNPARSQQRVVVVVDGSEQGVAAVRWTASHTTGGGHEVNPVILSEGRRPLQQVIEEADAIDADLIVVGALRTDGSLLGGLLGRRVGGLALDVLHETCRSLVLVPETTVG